MLFRSPLHIATYRCEPTRTPLAAKYPRFARIIKPSKSGKDEQADRFRLCRAHTNGRFRRKHGSHSLGRSESYNVVHGLMALASAAFDCTCDLPSWRSLFALRPFGASAIVGSVHEGECSRSQLRIRLRDGDALSCPSLRLASGRARGHCA